MIKVEAGIKDTKLRKRDDPPTKGYISKKTGQKGYFFRTNCNKFKTLAYV